MAESIGVLIVDDHAVVRKGLAALLAVRSEVYLAGEASDSKEAIQIANSEAPDVILMDLEMPGESGIEAIKKIRQEQKVSKILVLTSYSDDEHVIDAIRAGANGYLLKTTMPEDLLRAIQDVYLGKMPIDAAVTSTVVQELHQPADKKDEVSELLTDREIDVLELIAKGFTNQVIAKELMISERTASTHVSHILAKLEVENRTQAALYALRTGLVDINDS
ncbi:MAG: response regulator transcription factor [Candidatus Promineifilaceae bacterium]|nr:response regulator transcription factor [Candidatus Promineifilaceae bacterium]